MPRKNGKRKGNPNKPPDSTSRPKQPRKEKDDSMGKVFYDSIHGHIEVHPVCVKIIDTPQFQRLRDIKQLGGGYFVFPGASHNRFEHSIGTCYLAGEFVRSLRKRQPELKITEKDVLCVEIAGLCHDLGHGPFSHLFDRLFIPKAIAGTKWKHEDASLQMFDHMKKEEGVSEIFKKYQLNEGDETFIKELINGPTSTSEDWPYEGRGPEKRFLYEIVANKRTGIDVDKFDYFSRDCHCLGINNSFDHKRYINFARVIKLRGEQQICVRDKEGDNIYEIFHTRNRLFRRVYLHKTKNIIEIMIKEAFLKADKKIHFKGSEGKTLSISECIEDMEAYSQLSDRVYYQILNSSNRELQEAREILRRIQRRDLYRFVGQTINERRCDKEIPDIQRDIARCIKRGHKLDPEDFLIDTVSFDYGNKDKNPIDNVRCYHKSSPDKSDVLRKEEVSLMLPEKFAEYHIRVYFRKNNPELLEKAKRCFKHWCKQQ